jgi:hypothetical protein
MIDFYNREHWYFLFMHQNEYKLTFLNNIHPIWVALFVQLVVAFLVKGMLLIMPVWIIGMHFTAWWLSCQVIGVVVLSRWLALPVWWLWIQALFPLALYVGFTQTLVSTTWFGGIALFLLLIFSAVLGDRVPLYLTNAKTHKALVALAEAYQVHSMADLGAGLGGVVRALAAVGVQAQGVEYSPVLATIARAWCAWFGLGRVYQGDLWLADIRAVDMVYVFLSPVPMSRLWEKAQKEMKSGSILVSNSFPVEGVEPDDVWQLNDGRETLLYIYRIKK